MYYNPGDICFFNPPDNFMACVPGILHGPHPILILSNFTFNKCSPVINAVYISSSAKHTLAHVPIRIDKRQCSILCEQIYTLPKIYIEYYMGTLKPEPYKDVKTKLAMQLCL